MCAMIGMDAPAVQALSSVFMSSADSLDRSEQEISLRLRGTPWSGPACDRFRSQWYSSHAKDLARAAQLLRAIASELARESRQQEETSAAGPSTVSAPGEGWSDSSAAPPIPSPGPTPPVDSGAGKHGEDPWYSKSDDVIALGLAENAAHLAETLGWTHAAGHLRHYLGNSGDTLTVHPEQIMADVPGFRAAIDSSTAEELRRLAAAAAVNGDYGKPIAFTTDWTKYYIGKAESQDWFYAMGGIVYSVTGVATVHPPVYPGGQPTVDVDYQVHIFDRYNWDEGKSTQIGPFTITDEELAQLHRAGVAQEYDISGSTDIQHYTGDVPPSPTDPYLPPFDDGGDGGRDDPGRTRW